MPYLVSILIPAYNAEKWLGATVRSAVEQTWPNTEVIVVDDGSSDRTLQVAKQYESATVKVISQTNRGASAARNAALREAQGDYIQWLDADDLLAPDKLAQQLRFADGDETSEVLLSGAFGEFAHRPHNARFTPSPLWRDLQPIDYLLIKFTKNAWLNPAVWLVSRRLADLAGPWDERLSLDDDGEYFARVVTHCAGIRFVPEARVYYRRGNVASISRSVSDKACRSLLLSLRLCIDHLRSIEDSDRTRAAAVTLLQNWTDLGDCFCPDRPEMFAQAESLARELGGILHPTRLRRKYVPIKALLGWKRTRQIRTMVSNVKLVARVQANRLLP